MKKQEKSVIICCIKNLETTIDDGKEMDVKYNAIVIRASSYKDNDKMLSLFTLEDGIVSTCLRGAKKPNSKNGFAGELFNFCEFVLVKKDNRHTVKEVNQIDGFYKIRLDFDKFTVGAVAVEFVSSFLFEGMKSYDLFLTLLNTLKCLNETNFEPQIILIGYLLKALQLAGYELNFDDCYICRKQMTKRVFFNFDEGGCVCENCASLSDTEIKRKTYEVLSTVYGFVESGFSQEKYDEIVSKCKDVDRNGAIRMLDYVIKQKAGVTLKSLQSFV